jgi:hypothetical protein
MSDGSITIEFIGEGRTDRGQRDATEEDDSGVIVILTIKLCGSPASMRIKRRPIEFLPGKQLWQKVKFAKRQAYYNGSAGIVFVTDTEGEHPTQLHKLERGRDAELTDYPMAIGVAHPCIECWLLVDASAIRKALNLTANPALPESPELLPAPCKDQGKNPSNPKMALAHCAGLRSPLSSRQTTAIARAIRDLNSIEVHCPIGFAPFAEEVRARLRPLFEREVS